MSAIFKREFSSYMRNVTGPLFIALILMFEGITCLVYNLVLSSPHFEYSLNYLQLVLIVAVPVLAMRSLAEDKRGRIDQLLYSLPMSLSRVVMGKYFAMLTVLSVPVLVMSFIPFVLSMYGTVNYFSTYVGFLYFLLLIAAMLSICMFMSTVTESQVIAAVLGAGALIVCYFSVLLTSIVPKTESASLIACIVISVLIAGISYLFVKNYYVAIGVGAVLEAAVCIAYIIDSSVFLGLFGKMIDVIAIFDRFNLAVTSQMLDITTVAYYLSVSVFFCFLTGTAVEKRRYS